MQKNSTSSLQITPKNPNARNRDKLKRSLFTPKPSKSADLESASEQSQFLDLEDPAIIYGKSADETTIILFTEIPAPPEDPDETGLGISKQELAACLFSQLDNDEMRQFIASEVKFALTYGKIRAYPEWTKIFVQYQTHTRLFGNLSTAIADAVSEKRSPLKEKEVKEYQYVQEKVFDFRKQLTSLYAKKELITHYLKQVTSTSSTTFADKTLLWYAKQNNINLYIWKIGDYSNELQLDQLNEVELGKESKTIHLLKTENNSPLSILNVSSCHKCELTQGFESRFNSSL